MTPANSVTVKCDLRRNQAVTKAVQTDNEGRNQAICKAIQTDNEANAAVNDSDDGSMDLFVDNLQDKHEATLITGGYSVLQKKIISELNLWQNIVIRFAIIGESGSGKSSFINASSSSIFYLLKATGPRQQICILQMCKSNNGNIG
ncbi:uncharacterized protein LOC128225893 [Mya arenaria]|uniref:uncharacterized protein LOC128225893 n=1 Tax=Mya arenaria TaxID=6604 RepID=UPI0022E2621A|nr:uncharacterized protein LOC128225893 [Mya arenaria]